MDQAQLYTLRIWRHATHWRAAVRAVGDEGALLFTEPAQLAAWLQAGGPLAAVTPDQTCERAAARSTPQGG